MVYYMSDRTFLKKIIAVLTGFNTYLALISLFLMMLLITSDVILNKMIGRPIPGTLEVTSYYFMLFIVFLTLAQIEKTDSHISADFIVSRLPTKYQGAFIVLGKLLTLIFYSFLAYGATKQAIASTIRYETVMSNITFYVWPARWGIVLGLVSAILVIIMIVYLRYIKRS